MANASGVNTGKPIKRGRGRPSKLVRSEEILRQIFQATWDGESQRKIAKRYKVSSRSIRRILNGR